MVELNDQEWEAFIKELNKAPKASPQLKNSMEKFIQQHKQESSMSKEDLKNAITYGTYFGHLYYGITTGIVIGILMLVKYLVM